jgi:nucleotide-binding universal stress UspA family protein
MSRVLGPLTVFSKSDYRKGATMFRKVLAGVDGHLGGRDAVALAAQLTAGDGTLSLAHVYPARGDPLHHDYNDYEAAQYVHARDVLEAARKEAGFPVELRWSASTSPGRGLHQLAEALGSDLLVVGSCRHGPLRRVMVGDDTRAALDGAPCAVAIAPAGYAEEPATIRTIGVGYDGSPESKRAVELATSLARELDAVVAALEVVSFPAYLFRGAARGDNTSFEELISDTRDRVASIGDAEPHAAYGQAAEELARWGETVDLLLVGSRGYGPVGRLVHGSTSRALANTAHCPLLVLTRATAVTSSPGAAHPDRALAAT